MRSRSAGFSTNPIGLLKFVTRVVRGGIDDLDLNEPASCRR